MKQRYYDEISSDIGKKLCLENFDLYTYASSLTGTKTWIDLILYVIAHGTFLPSAGNDEERLYYYHDRASYVQTTIKSKIYDILRTHDKDFVLKVTKEVDEIVGQFPRSYAGKVSLESYW